MSGDDFTSSKSRESDRHRNATITYPTQMRAQPTIAVLTNPSNVSPTWSNQSNERANMTGTASADGVTEVVGTISADAEL